MSNIIIIRFYFGLSFKAKEKLLVDLRPSLKQMLRYTSFPEWALHAAYGFKYIPNDSHASNKSSSLYDTCLMYIRFGLPLLYPPYVSWVTFYLKTNDKNSLLLPIPKLNIKAKKKYYKIVESTKIMLSSPINLIY